jgi:hypothetical protein
MLVRRGLALGYWTIAHALLSAAILGAGVVTYGQPEWVFECVLWLLFFPEFCYKRLGLVVCPKEALIDQPGALLRKSSSWVAIVYPIWLVWKRYSRTDGPRPSRTPEDEKRNNAVRSFPAMDRHAEAISPDGIVKINR